MVIASTLTSQAQLSQSSEPRPTHDILTGEVIIMPIILRHDAPKLAAAKALATKTARLRNRAQMRTAKADSTRNGYYPGMGNRHWGTTMRMNNFWFLPPANPASGL